MIFVIYINIMDFENDINIENIDKNKDINSLHLLQFFIFIFQSNVEIK